jgi:Skp family chaperone for outer membrane proteins
MKKSFSLFAVILLLCGSVSAQKFGYFNSLEVLAIVPEVKAADSELQASEKRRNPLARPANKSCQPRR